MAIAQEHALCKREGVTGGNQVLKTAGDTVTTHSVFCLANEERRKELSQWFSHKFCDK